MLSRAARINRLPDHNRLQTMELLKAAWEKIDVRLPASSYSPVPPPATAIS